MPIKRPLKNRGRGARVPGEAINDQLTAINGKFLMEL